MNAYADAVILNVDDNDGARYAKTRTLVRAGFSVIEASGGEEALAKARSEIPNLILLDVKLPDINGLEVCRILKGDIDTQHILILQTSASYIGTADKIRALDGGADNYLVEPIEPDELIANVNALLRLGNVERELREVDRRKDEFLATLAHELRNPLGPIRHAVELLRKLDPVVEPLQESARNTIQRHTNHLARLVDDLLDVSRISKGKISLRWEQVELKSFVQSALETSAPAISRKQHTLTVNLPEQPVWIRGDHVRLSQIVANLLLNAAKFTNPGGKIDLTAEVVDNRVLVRLTDNGIGVAADSTHSIFELFIQSGHASNQLHDGLGIGLSLVRTLVNLHSGEVKVTSPGVGKGSTFEVSLPIDSSAKAPSDVMRKHVAKVSKRILIIDDNKDAAITLGQLLELNDHIVKTAFTGNDGIELAKAFRPDLIFLDIGLPDLTGYEVAIKLRALPNGKDINLIALTGYGQAHDRKAALDSGFDEHFVKPIDMSKFEALGLID